jgi:hypothetical protein
MPSRLGSPTCILRMTDGSNLRRASQRAGGAVGEPLLGHAIFIFLILLRAGHARVNSSSVGADTPSKLTGLVCCRRRARRWAAAVAGNRSPEPADWVGSDHGGRRCRSALVPPTGSRGAELAARRNRHRQQPGTRVQLGDGASAGTGAGAFRIANAMLAPPLLKEVKRDYTDDAMPLALQSDVELAPPSVRTAA